MIRISIDLMGGDFGPQVVIPGAAKALERHPDIFFVMYGLKEQCEPVLDRFPKLKEKTVFHDCELAVRMDEKPSQALRRGRGKASMWQAIEAVNKGEAALLYCFLFLYLACAGGGIWSLDAQVRKRP